MKLVDQAVLEPSAVIDLFQRLVAAARSPDATMRRLAEWVIDHQSRVSDMSISALASEVGVSETTVFRFCKLVGLSGYRDLRLALAEGRGVALGTRLAQAATSDGEDEGSPFAGIVRRVIEVNSEALIKTMGLVSPSHLAAATEAIVQANHIHLVAFGSSAPVAFDAYQRFLCLGLTVSVHSDPHILAAVMANVRPGALFFGITCSGRTRDLIEAFESAGTGGFPRVVVTSDPNSPATGVADIVLTSSIRRSPIARETIATRISQLAIVEMLCVGIALDHSDRATISREEKKLEEELAKKRL
ncbi:MAG: MurR/RpiR family transcriptional regulator [Hyphomicrobiales bacterium]|nr:MurR/RpiR family transcriptional regulator [Hyphomicrobiales bacterium]